MIRLRLHLSLRLRTLVNMGTGFLSDCPSLMLGIAIRCIQHSQAMFERGLGELAHSFFHSLWFPFPDIESSFRVFFYQCLSLQSIKCLI